MLVQARDLTNIHDLPIRACICQTTLVCQTANASVSGCASVEDLDHMISIGTSNVKLDSTFDSTSNVCESESICNLLTHVGGASGQGAEARHWQNASPKPEASLRKCTCSLAARH